MESRDIILCILFWLSLVQAEVPFVNSRCRQASSVSQGFTYKQSFNINTNNESIPVHDWCSKLEVKADKINECGRGKVRLTFSLKHPDKDVNRFTIVLKYRNETCDSKETNFSLHSNYEISIENSKPPTLNNQDVELLFDYISTGCYMMEITPKINHSPLRNCKTHDFTLITNYTRTLITKPNGSSGDLNQREGYLNIIDNGGLYEAFSVLVSLLNNSKPIRCCSPDQQKIEEFNKNQADPQCYASIDAPSMPPKVEKNEGCSCYWEIQPPYKSLKCLFSNLDPGKYLAAVVVIDPRCIFYHKFCSFNFNLLIEENNTSQTPPSVIISKINNVWIWCSTLFFIIVAALVVIFIFYKYKLKPRYDHLQLLYDRSSIDKTTQILLLYPRDCEPFMKAMESFRAFLKSINHFEVYDALDPAQEEMVSLNANTWGLNLLTDKSTKVILVASWCSLKLYKSLLDKNSVRYLDRQPFDHLFQYHLNQLLGKNDQYSKIYVVRLNCNNAVNLEFEHITQSRIFTLPQFTGDLVNQLLDLSPETTIIFEEASRNEKLIGTLQDAIKNYSKFVDENPNYLNTILRENLIHLD